MPCTLDPERLVAWLDGDLPGAAATQVADHVQACPQCRERARRLQRQDSALQTEMSRDVPTDVLARLRHALPWRDAAELWPDVLTLDEVARYLRVSLDDLDQFAADLPAFDVAGQVRVRRSALEGWLARREQDYASQRLRGAATSRGRQQAG